MWTVKERENSRKVLRFWPGQVGEWRCGSQSPNGMGRWREMIMHGEHGGVEEAEGCPGGEGQWAVGCLALKLRRVLG